MSPRTALAFPFDAAPLEGELVGGGRAYLFLVEFLGEGSGHGVLCEKIVLSSNQHPLVISAWFCVASFSTGLR